MLVVKDADQTLDVDPPAFFLKWRGVFVVNCQCGYIFHRLSI